MTDFNKRPLLILDLDETIIFGSEVKLHRSPDFRVGQFYVYQRPYLQAFLQSVSKYYDLAIWSSASASYVLGISKQLASTQAFEWQFIWSRSNCVQKTDLESRETIFIKDLKKTKRFGYTLERTLIVDDSRHKVSRNYGNAIYISPFEGVEDDAELEPLAAYITSLQREPNFRKIEKRGWRNKLHGFNSGQTGTENAG